VVYYSLFDYAVAYVYWQQDEAMNRKTGWHSKTGDPSAFEVYETQRDETSDVLAKMLQQDQE
jgi:hypothetical protein